MRVNVYAEEMTDQIEIISKEIDGRQFTGLRIYLHLPVTLPCGTQAQGPFMHHPGDDDSSAVTFWGKQDLRVTLKKMLDALDKHYDPENTDIPKVLATLSGREIFDLAQFANVDCADPMPDDDAETEYTLCKCPPSGLYDEDTGERDHYYLIAYLTEYPEEGAVGLGMPISEKVNNPGLF